MAIDVLHPTAPVGRDRRRRTRSSHLDVQHRELNLVGRLRARHRDRQRRRQARSRRRTGRRGLASVADGAAARGDTFLGESSERPRFLGTVSRASAPERRRISRAAVSPTAGSMAPAKTRNGTQCLQPRTRRARIRRSAQLAHHAARTGTRLSAACFRGDRSERSRRGSVWRESRRSRAPAGCYPGCYRRVRAGSRPFGRHFTPCRQEYSRGHRSGAGSRRIASTRRACRPARCRRTAVAPS